MSVQGRTTPRWGRDKSARWDPGPTNRSRSYPPRPLIAQPESVEVKRADLPGRPGAAERAMLIEKNQHYHVSLTGWFTDKVSLDERQARFLRDTLNLWLPAELTD